MPPKYTNGTEPEARLFVRGSPERPPVPNPLVTFTDEALLHDETFTVGPGREVLTGIVLSWGDQWEITASGELSVDGGTVGPRRDRRRHRRRTCDFRSIADAIRTARCTGWWPHLNNYVFIARGGARSAGCTPRRPCCTCG